MELRTHQGGQPPAHEGGGRAHPLRARPLPRGPMVALLHLSFHPHILLTPTNTNIQFIPESKLILLPFLISLLKVPLTKLLGEIVPEGNMP